MRLVEPSWPGPHPARPRSRLRPARWPATRILDGEVCLFDDRLISRFEWLRERPKAETATPPIFMAFDCLWVAGRDLREQDLQLKLHDRAGDAKQRPAGRGCSVHGLVDDD